MPGFFFHGSGEEEKLIHRIDVNTIGWRKYILSAADMRFLKIHDAGIMFKEFIVNKFHLNIIRGDARTKLKLKYILPAEALLLNYMLRDGTMNYTVNDQDVQQEANSYSVFYHKGGSIDLELPKGSYSMLQLCVSVKYISCMNVHFHFKNSWKNSGGPVANFIIDDGLNECVRHILSCRLSGVLKERFFSLKVDELLFCLNRHITGADGSKRLYLDNTETVMLSSIMYYIEANMDSTITIYTIMRTFHLSEYKIKKLFQAAGMSFAFFVTTVRMKRGMILLSTTRDKISVIAKSVGYASASKFSQAFNKHFGILPSMVRGKIADQDMEE